MMARGPNGAIQSGYQSRKNSGSIGRLRRIARGLFFYCSRNACASPRVAVMMQCALMNKELQSIVDTFQSVDVETRLSLLLDYSNKLPALPGKYAELRDAGINRVHECMTPVFVFAEECDSNVSLFIDVAQEAPTIRGFAGILHEALQGATVDDIKSLPADLANQLCLSEVLRMNRAVGLAALIARVKAEVEKQTD